MTAMQAVIHTRMQPRGVQYCLGVSKIEAAVRKCVILAKKRGILTRFFGQTKAESWQKG